MDFSDIRTIIIGEAGEYGKRLVRYLEIHLHLQCVYIILQRQKAWFLLKKRQRFIF